MALRHADKIPDDAKLISDTEAVGYAWETIENWGSLKDTWALRYSMGIVGGVNSISGLVINNYFRRKLKLGWYGHLSSLIPLVLLPGTFTALFHRYFVSTDMILMKNEGCPICFELRSSAIQIGLGTVYPMVLGPVATFMLASRYNTIRMPSLVGETRELFKFARNITRPFYGTLSTLVALQFITSSIVTYYEIQNNFTVRYKLMRIEEKLLEAGKIP